METPESIRTSLIPGEWVSSIDLSDAYLHIPIHPNSRKYLRFCYKSQVFQFTSLPFGLATAPQVLTMIVKEVKLMALSRGLRIHQYLDDWLIRSQSQEEAQVNTQTVVDLTQSLGWIINQEKSELKPTQVFSFVGYEYHLDSALVKPTQERWLKLQDLILRLKSKHVLTARCLMSLIGLLASTEKMVPEGRLHMRPFQFHLKEHWRYPQSLDNLLPWTEAIAAHLDWWQNPSNLMKGADLHPKHHSIQLFTDASNEGWGAHLDQNSTKGLWSDQGKRLHINVLELKAVSLALRDFKDQCQNHCTIVDRQFKEDSTLCPVRALRYYLDRTKDLRGSRSLLFISFKKGHTSDIRPATLSSWLKQTILLCYKQADQQALYLVQVKAHDIRAFAASKAFYGGVSVDQIMQACHWKAHNTFTNFYLKDLTWSDNDNNMYLGPVVAAQQVLDPSPRTSCPRKEKRGGGGGGGHIRYNQVFRSLSQDLGILLPSRCYG